MDRARPIYTDEMHKKIVARLEELIEQSKKIWPDHAVKFIMPVVRYDLKGKVGGTAQCPHGSKPILRFNLIMCYENEEHFIKQTVGHEWAHVVQRMVYGHTKQVKNKDGEMVTKKVMPHGQEWFGVMKELGLELAKYHSYQMKSIHSAPRKPRTARENILMVSRRIKNIKSNFEKLPEDFRQELIEWAQNFQDEPVEN